MSYHPAYKTLRKPLINAKFANDRSGWPKADSSKAFILEVICIVGGAKFGAEWTGREVQAQDWPLQPQEAHDRSLSRAMLNSGGGAPGSRPRSLHQSNNPLLEQLAKTPDAHVRDYRAERTRQLVRAEQADWVENQQARDRLSATVEWIAQRCRDGELIGYVRLVAGGTLYPMEPSEWNVENALQKFVCEGSFKRYFRGAAQPWTVYAFFDRAAVEKATATLANAPAFLSDLDLQRVSPYLRMAVKLALAKGYTSPESPDTQAVREAEVRAAWHDSMPDIPQSKKAVEAIVKVIGFPNPTAIRQGTASRSRKTAGSPNG